ncbi:MAG: AmmeMemoRadiSam system radical SAM enzyme [Nanoarchaeota archaeon]
MIKECILYKKEKGRKVRCLACAHKCIINEGKTGICSVRKNINGKIYLLVYGKIASLGIDPIEKKPLYHFLPGTYAFSIGTIGCNFKCDFCQNFDISQASKKKVSSKQSFEDCQIFGEEMSPNEVVNKAIKTECKSIAYTYNEPVIWIEFVKDCAVIAEKKGLKNILVTNGYFSYESFDFIKDYIDAMNIDLKGNDRYYKKLCGGKLKPVLDTIKRAYKKGIHIEITTLIVPGENDDEKELEKIAKFIAGIDKNIPWHISRFFPRYKMMKKEATPLDSLKMAEKIGKKAGLKNVHLGNA